MTQEASMRNGILIVGVVFAITLAVIVGASAWLARSAVTPSSAPSLLTLSLLI